MKNKEFHFLLLGLLNVLQLADCDKIRVVGPSRCSGRVEVFYRNSWGTVCDDYWSLNNADVVCRELNCGTALEATSRAHFGEGKNDIWMDDVKCVGTESALSKCPHRELGENNCGHGEDAGVICSEHLRLVNGTDRCSGKVEVYHSGHWKKLCANGWTKKEANVVCRELTCGTPSSDKLPQFGQENGRHGVRSSCHGNETSLAQCAIEAFNETCVDATVLCKNVNIVRLANGTSRCSGRVEVFHNAQWGSVCDDRWGMQDATVACQELNCGAPMAVKYRAFFGEGNGHVWMDDVECIGIEKSITECPHRGFGENDCGHGEDASIICSDKTRLANGTDRCSGRLEVFHDDEWVKLCSSDWSSSKATLVCNELECGNPSNPQVKPYFGESIGLRGFTSRCLGNETSIADCQLQPNSAKCENVALKCTGHPQIKLVNGTDRCSGRVEVYHDGQWGTICDDQWDLNDAQVVCKEVDCGTAQTAKSRGFFGKGLGEIWLDDMECLGHESALDACPHNAYGDNNCGHAEDAGVICSSTIRLFNGTDHCSGRLEVYHNGQWLPVYESDWGTREIGVVCRETDCGDAVTPVVTSSVVPYTGQRGYIASCQGTETSLTQCSLRESVKTSRDNVKEAAVACTGNVKLVNGSNRCSGRVEFYRNGEWGKVCGDSWDMNDAQVVCSQLDCGRAHKVLNTDEFGLGSGRTWIESIECNGRESSLSQCVQTEDPSIACNHSSVASVICSDNLDVRLVGATDHCSGRVEVRHGEQWGTLCEHGWTMNEAEMVCKMLECGKAVRAPGGAHFGQGTGPIWEASQACFSSEASLHQCSIRGFNNTRCSHEEDAGVICAEQLRLVNGRGQCSGRVEVFHKGLWGTVCDDEWEISNAEVVCRQVGCGVAISALTSAHFGRGNGPIWLDNVECTGSESALTQCSHNTFGDNNCGHGEDAGVVCMGSLPKPQIILSPGPEVKWGERIEITCMMTTEHLGGTFVLQKTPGTFRLEKYTDHEAAVFIIPKADYSHKGSYHCEYRKRLATQNIEFPLGDEAELSVTVMLETPSISLTSPHAMVIFSPDNLEVNKGSSFSITCSIHSQYLGGFFYLTTSTSNASEPKPVFSHSVFLLAYFDFPVVEYKDQGEYRCVYGVNISSLTFRSEPSKSLRVTVIASSVSPAVSGVLGGLVVLLLLLAGGYLVWRKRHQIGRASVRFSSRVGELREAGIEDTGAKGHGVFDGRDSIVNEQGNSHSLEDKSNDADSNNTVDRNATEDLTGRVCYELEPLIHDS